MPCRRRTSLERYVEERAGPAGNPYPLPVPADAVPLHKRLLAVALGRAKAFTDAARFKEPTDVMVGWCRRHRTFYLDYEHGFTRSLTCPLCAKERGLL